MFLAPFLRPRSVQERFEDLKTDNHENLIGVTVLTASDCDAMAAQRILAVSLNTIFLSPFPAQPLSSHTTRGGFQS